MSPKYTIGYLDATSKEALIEIILCLQRDIEDLEARNSQLFLLLSKVVSNSSMEPKEAVDAWNRRMNDGTA